MDYKSWLEHHMASSMPWHRHVDGRREEAVRPRRTASQFAIASYGTLNEARSTYAAWGALPRGERAYAWSEDRVEDRQRVDPTADPAPNRPLDHVRRWDRALASDERRWIGAPAVAELHSFYCSQAGYVPFLPTALALYPAPTGGQASLAAAHVNGVDFGTPEARRQAFRRATPLYEDRFTVVIKPDSDG